MTWTTAIIRSCGPSIPHVIEIKMVPIPPTTPMTPRDQSDPAALRREEEYMVKTL